MKVIHATTDGQLRDAHAVRKKVFVEEQNVPIEIELDEHEKTASHFVLYDGKEPVGAGRLRIFDGKGKVERICVLPSHRGKGAGKEIMMKIEEHAKELQIDDLILNSQSSAIPFYEKLGYKIISEPFMEAGIPHQAMKKTIK
jgi:predicted GNAT family N-acyltransferase